MNWCPDNFVWSDLRNYCYHLFSTFPWAILTGFLGTYCPSHSPYSRCRGAVKRAAANPDGWTLRWTEWAVTPARGVVISHISVLPSAAFMWLRSELILTVLNPMEVKISSLHLTASYWSSQYAAKIVFYITLSFSFWFIAFLICKCIY